MKSILSGVVAGIAGIKGTVDKNLFFQRTIAVLIAQMDAERKTVLAGRPRRSRTRIPPNTH